MSDQTNDLTKAEVAEQTRSMDLLRFATAGSVDDGKSTLIGRLLLDSKSIFEDQLEAVEATSIVMPCSRSARRPSVRRARFVCSAPIASLDRSTASSWSSKIDFESRRRRPMRVDLPSSTEPAVAKRSRSI